MAFSFVRLDAVNDPRFRLMFMGHQLRFRWFLLCLAIIRLGVANSEASAGREVLIWYVNETAPNEADRHNYETIIGWLESGKSDKAQQLATGLRNELTLFRDAVDREQVLIEEGVIASGRLEAMLITNRLARAGKYRFYDAMRGRFAEAPLALPREEDYVLASNPLVRRQTLKAVLAAAAERYDPPGHRFVLITSRMAIRKRL